MPLAHYRLDLLLARLRQLVAADRPCWVPDPQCPGGRVFLYPPYGFPVADHTAGGVAVARLGYLLLLDPDPPGGAAALRDDLLHGLRFLRRMQRPTGLIDLPLVDFDSPPDTAFVVQLLCPLLDAARRRHAADATAGWGPLLAAFEDFLRPAATGIVGRGFATPNHRWVVASALAQAMSAFPDLTATALPYADALLAEGIDINPDGDYSERSSGIYNGVCNRALRLLAHHLDRPDLLAHVRANLDLLLDLLDADGQVVTAGSQRQDHQHRAVPLIVADSYFELAHRDGRGDYLHAADLLAAGDDPRHFVWLLHPLLTGAVPLRRDLAPQPPPAATDRVYRHSRLWRRKTADFSAVLLAGQVEFLGLRCGPLTLQGLALRGRYFHHSTFQGDTFEPGDAGVTMRFDGRRRETPGWDLPLGRPVRFDHPEQFYELRRSGQRRRWELPVLSLRVEATRRAEGFELRLRSEGGLDRVPFTLEARFDPVGQFTAAGRSVPAAAGQRVLLRAGLGQLHHDGWCIELGPGAAAHTLTPAPAPPTSFTVVIPLLTPFDHPLTIRCGRSPLASVTRQRDGDACDV